MNKPTPSAIPNIDLSRDELSDLIECVQQSVASLEVFYGTGEIVMRLDKLRLKLKHARLEMVLFNEKSVKVGL